MPTNNPALCPVCSAPLHYWVSMNSLISRFWTDWRLRYLKVAYPLHPQSARHFFLDRQEPSCLLNLHDDRLEVVTQLQGTRETEHTWQRCCAGGHIKNCESWNSFCQPATLVTEPWHPSFQQVRMYGCTVRIVLVYGSHTWPLHVEHARQLSVFDHRYVWNIVNIQHFGCILCVIKFLVK